MTASPEAFLAREAELCYATMAHVTDYDVWRESEEPVTVDMLIETLNKNTLIAQNAIHNLLRGLKPERPCQCGQALSTALITDPKVIPAETRKNLDLLVGKYLK
jgi:5'-methylthioadenosine phosphorylase